MPLPNVIVAGAQKCGTTALHRMFRRHPECSGGRIKETHFLIEGDPWDLGRWSKGTEWWAANYDDVAVRADLSPSYSMAPIFPGVPGRAALVVPDALVVYLVRCPIERVASHYRLWRAQMFESRSFERCVFERPDFNMFVACSSYATQLELWRERFDDDQILVMHQDEVRCGASRLFDRLGVGQPPPLAEPVNRTDDLRRPTGLARRLPTRVSQRLPLSLRSRPVPPPDVSSELEGRLRELFRPEAVRFEEMTGVRVADWVHG